MLYVFVEKINPAIVTEISNARRQANPEIKLCFESSIRCQKAVMTIKDAEIISGSTGGVNVVSWNINNGQASFDNEVYFALAQKPNFNNYVLLDDIIHPKGCKTFFFDRKNDPHYPDKFYKLPSFTTYSDVLNYGISKNFINHFSLENKKRFQKTKLIEHGEIVYKEFTTGYFWYFDNFHKNHYEVFDSNGEHVAEADMDGNMIPKSQIKGRTIQV